ncbi:Phosphoribosylformylglycinamidine cyclo-ligase, chloroplastic/mitochondrial [Cinnamomum micranthum f. kanehirae]|uniref:phosphoribosylformylglycinamidine cyclo-ligase n=1 Tax=Cinnamomum micranthum f. kanehirae TaxID=337451 RepID=A0A3S3P0Q0_9MAGN|nr:Phosphoribosylformylglycinamidine cyclo-ligase, chloroplastic/mitochondrial [Cinnamomum micranthum f. kanehirae]
MNWTTSCLGLTKAEAFHGVFTSVAAPKPFIEKSYFPPKPYPSFFFQRSSQKPHLSFSHNARTSKSIGIIREWDYGGPFPRAREGFELTVALIVNNILTFWSKTSAIEKVNLYFEGEYDLGCFAKGIVKKDSVIDGKNIVAGDYLIGLPSSAVHWSGFSLVRRALAESGLSLKDQLPGGCGKPITLGEALMAPTVIYVKQVIPYTQTPTFQSNIRMNIRCIVIINDYHFCFEKVLDIISKGGVKAITHITGGGLMDNIPESFQRALELPSIETLGSFLVDVGRIEDAVMRRTFGMGIGMVLVVSPEAASRILQDATSKPSLERHGGNLAYTIGEVSRREVSLDISLDKEEKKLQ